MRHARALMHAWIANPQWQGKRYRHSLRMHDPQFYVSGKRPMAAINTHLATHWGSTGDSVACEGSITADTPTENRYEVTMYGSLFFNLLNNTHAFWAYCKPFVGQEIFVNGYADGSGHESVAVLLPGFAIKTRSQDSRVFVTCPRCIYTFMD